MWDYNYIGNGREKKDNSDKQEQMSRFLLWGFERLPLADTTYKRSPNLTIKKRE